MSKIYNFFPLSIYRGKIELPKNIKKEMIDEIIIIKKTSDNGSKPPQNAWTGDTHGHEYLFQNKKFEFFYKEVEKHIIKYMDHFELDVSKLEFYFQRSWATLSGSQEHISPHDHSQSNLSFAYYLKKSDTDANLLFIDETKHNEFLPGLFLSPSTNKKQVIKKRNISNTAAIVFDAKEDEIVIFPSKTAHQTQPNIKNNDRISISADIFIVSKNSENLEHLVSPFKDWKNI